MIEAFRHIASASSQKESNDNDSDSLSQIVDQKLESFSKPHEGSFPQNIYDVICPQVERPFFKNAFLSERANNL